MITAAIQILILGFLMITTTAFANITVISDLSPLKNTLKNIDQDTLVIFDVDHVLIMPTDESTVNRHPYRKKLLKAIEAKLSKEEIKTLYGLTASKAKWQLVDHEILDIFNHLQQNKIDSIALTSIYTGKYGVIDKIENWRIKHLNELGFDFTNLTPMMAKEATLIPELSNGHDGIPLLKAGVVFTAQIDKAIVLEYLLKHYNYYPKTIVFVDDQLSNLESLEKLANKLAIKFHGFHYIAASLLPLPIINKQKEKRRFEILEKEHLWLSHDELDERERLTDAKNNFGKALYFSTFYK